MSEAKNNATSEIFSVDPVLFNGIFCFHDFKTSSGNLSVISVSMKPGAITLHLIFLDPSSNAIDLEKPMIADFDAE